jgi:hypothetical protein
MSIDANKLLRWAIPGWVTFLSILIYFSIDMALNTQGILVQSIRCIVENNSPLLGTFGITGTSLLIAVVGFPLGFLIYQIYYYSRWNSPLSSEGLPFYSEYGRNDEQKRMLNDISNQQLIIGPGSWRDKIVNDKRFKSSHQYTAGYLDPLFLEILSRDNKGEKIYRRYLYLNEILHILGASIVGINIGFFLYAFLKSRIEYQFSPERATIVLDIIVFTAFIFLVFFILSGLEDKYRFYWRAEKKKNSVKNRLRVLVNYLNLIFCVLFGSSIFLLDPFIFSNGYNVNQAPYIGKLLMVFILLLFLFFTIIFTNPTIFKMKGNLDSLSKRILNNSVLALFIFMIMMMIIHQGIYNYYVGVKVEEIYNNWSITPSLFLLLAMNVFLSKNRQNAQENIIELVRYSLLCEIHEKPRKRKIHSNK